jgi:hypothetical protein
MLCEQLATYENDVKRMLIETKHLNRNNRDKINNKESSINEIRNIYSNNEIDDDRINIIINKLKRIKNGTI